MIHSKPGEQAGDKGIRGLYGIEVWGLQLVVEGFFEGFGGIEILEKIGTKVRYQSLPVPYGMTAIGNSKKQDRLTISLRIVRIDQTD